MMEQKDPRPVQEEKNTRDEDGQRVNECKGKNMKMNFFLVLLFESTLSLYCTYSSIVGKSSHFGHASGG